MKQTLDFFHELMYSTDIKLSSVSLDHILVLFSGLAPNILNEQFYCILLLRFMSFCCFWSLFCLPINLRNIELRKRNIDMEKSWDETSTTLFLSAIIGKYSFLRIDSIPFDLPLQVWRSEHSYFQHDSM